MIYKEKNETLHRIALNEIGDPQKSLKSLNIATLQNIFRIIHLEFCHLMPAR